MFPIIPSHSNTVTTTIDSQASTSSSTSSVDSRHICYEGISVPSTSMDLSSDNVDRYVSELDTDNDDGKVASLLEKYVSIRRICEVSEHSIADISDVQASSSGPMLGSIDQGLNDILYGPCPSSSNIVLHGPITDPGEDLNDILYGPCPSSSSVTDTRLPIENTVLLDADQLCDVQPMEISSEQVWESFVDRLLQGSSNAVTASTCSDAMEVDATALGNGDNVQSTSNNGSGSYDVYTLEEVEEVIADDWLSGISCSTIQYNLDEIEEVIVSDLLTGINGDNMQNLMDGISEIMVSDLLSDMSGSMIRYSLDDVEELIIGDLLTGVDSNNIQTLVDGIDEVLAADKPAS